MIVLRSATYVC